MAKRQLLMLGIRTSFHTIAAVLVAGLIFTAVFLSRNSLPKENPQSHGVTDRGGHSGRECNLFEGKWVFDNVSYPLYKEEDCKFMSDQLACEKFGRKDLSYKFWRWQPHTCDLPRFFSFFVIFTFTFLHMSFLSLSMAISIKVYTIKMLHVALSPLLIYFPVLLSSYICISIHI